MIRWWVVQQVTITISLCGIVNPSAHNQRGARKFCETLLFKFPILLFATHRGDLLWTISPAVHWHHTCRLEKGNFIVHVGNNTTKDGLPVQSIADCDWAVAFHTPQAKVIFLAHPALTRLIYLYGNGGRRMNRRRSYNAFVRRARFSQGVVNRDTSIARLEIAS